MARSREGAPSDKALKGTSNRGVLVLLEHLFGDWLHMPGRESASLWWYIIGSVRTFMISQVVERDAVCV